MAVKLPKSLRRHIRERKATLRRQFGPDSPQEQELMEWVRQRRKEKVRKVDKPNRLR